MFTLEETPAQYKQLASNLKQISSSLVSELKRIDELKIIPAETNIAVDEFAQQIIHLKDGCLTHKVNGKILFVYEEGDLIFPQNAIGINSEIYSEFATKADIYLLSDLSASRAQLELHAEYNAIREKMMNVLLSSLLGNETPIDPKFNKYVQGDTIIAEGHTGDEVFTLVEGEAEVFKEGVKVGDILRDEIFGMISAITGTPRTATVIASSNCLALSVPNKNFLQLIKNKPLTAHKLLDDMSRLIIELNERVVGLNKNRKIT